MLVFLGDDHGCIHFGALDQCFGACGEEIGVHVISQAAAQVLVDVAKSQPFDARIFAGELGADAPDGASADDSEADFGDRVQGIGHEFSLS